MNPTLADGFSNLQHRSVSKVKIAHRESVFELEVKPRHESKDVLGRAIGYNISVLLFETIGKGARSLVLRP